MRRYDWIWLDTEHKINDYIRCFLMGDMLMRSNRA